MPPDRDVRPFSIRSRRPNEADFASFASSKSFKANEAAHLLRCNKSAKRRGAAELGVRRESHVARHVSRGKMLPP